MNLDLSVDRFEPDSEMEFPMYVSYSDSYIRPIGKCNVSIKSVPTVESIELDDITVIENSNGCWEVDEENNSVFRYNLVDNNINGTITFSDGTVSEITSGNFTDPTGSYCYIYCSDPAEGIWETGNTYQINAYYGEIETTFNVTVKGSPIKAIHFDDFSILESGYYYNVYPDNGYVEMKDDTIVPIDKVITLNKEDNGGWSFGSLGGYGGIDYQLGFTYEGQTYAITFEYTSSDSVEHGSMYFYNILNCFDGLGSYEVTLCCQDLGFNSSTMNITIEESDIKDVVLEDKVIEVILAGSGTLTTYCYLTDYEVILNDGTVTNYIDYQMQHPGIHLFLSEEYHGDLSSGDTIVCTHTLFGKEYSHNLTVVGINKTPTKLEIEKLENIPENQFDDNTFIGSTFSVYYSDGTSKIVDRDSVYYQGGGFHFGELFTPYSINEINTGDSFLISGNNYAFSNVAITFESGSVVNIESSEITSFQSYSHGGISINYKLHTDVGDIRMCLWVTDSQISLYMYSYLGYETLYGSFYTEELNHADCVNDFAENIHFMLESASDYIEKSQNYSGTEAYQIDDVVVVMTDENTMKLTGTLNDDATIEIVYYMDKDTVEIKYSVPCEHVASDVWTDAGTYHCKVCTICGIEVESDNHKYINDCDTTCDDCGHVRTVTHKYVVKVTKPATETETGIKTYTCSICGDNYTEVIPVVKPVSKGDLNGDTKINAIDSNLMSKLILGQYDANDQVIYAADINEDGKVNAIDANLITAMIVG